jgi:hypothetical protein
MTNAPVAAIVDDVPTESAEAPVDPAQQEAAAREHLAATNRRLDALALRQHVREAQLAALAEQERTAQAEVGRTRDALAPYPDVRNRIRARILIAGSLPARHAMERDLESLQAQEQDAFQAHQAATAEAARVADEVRRERARLTEEGLEERAERCELEALAPALVAEMAAAHAAAGAALLERMQAQHAKHLSQVEAAEIALAEAKAAAEQHQAAASAALGQYPGAHLQARQAGLLPAEPPDKVEHLLAAYLHYIRALQSSGPFRELPVFDSIALPNVLGSLSPHGIRYALTADPAPLGRHILFVEQALATVQARRQRQHP